MRRQSSWGRSVKRSRFLISSRWRSSARVLLVRSGYANGTRVVNQWLSRNWRNLRWSSRIKSCNPERKGMSWRMLIKIHGLSPWSAPSKTMTTSIWSCSISLAEISWTYSWRRTFSRMKRHNFTPLKSCNPWILCIRWSIYIGISNLIMSYLISPGTSSYQILDCVSIPRSGRRNWPIISSVIQRQA